MAKNKVVFGIENLHVFTYSVASDNTVTLGTPYHQPGAVGFAPEQDSSEQTFYADNIAYWSEYADGPFSGDLEVAKYDDDFKIEFLGYKRLTSGGLAQIKGASKPNVCIAFEYVGDVEHRRQVFYNCSLGSIGREFNTISDAKEPNTETLPINCAGDNVSGVFHEVLKPGDAGYDVLFTDPIVPELDSE